MTQTLATIISDFETSLSTAVSVGQTTATLTSAIDDDGINLPSGVYFFTCDASNSLKEFFKCDLVGTALTNIKSISRQNAEVTGYVRAHRLGATITITDHAHLRRINNLLDGTTNLNASIPLGYDGTATISTPNQIATKSYADALAIAGAPDSSTVTKGIGRVSVAPVAPATPIFVGDNDTRVPVVNSSSLTAGQLLAMPGNNTDVAVGTGNRYVTQTGLQHGAELFAADTGSTDDYVITLSPAPTSYTSGMVFRFKANTSNTGATTLNVNGLGARTIRRDVGENLQNNDIIANQIVSVIFDGTNLQLLSGLPIRASGGTLTLSSTGTTIITTNFKAKSVRVSATASATSGISTSNGSFDVTSNTNQCVFTTFNQNGNQWAANVSAVNCLTTNAGNNASNSTAIINNVTSTSFDIVFSKGTSENSFVTWEAIG